MAQRMPPLRQLTEHAVGDGVVVASVCGALGDSEVIEIVPVALGCQAVSLGGDLLRMFNRTAPVTGELDELALFSAGRSRHDGDEGES